MAMNDTLAAALSTIFHADAVGKSTCMVKPFSKVITKILEILKANHYVGTFEVNPQQRGTLTLHLLGKVNNCGAIKPRFSLKADELEKWEKRYLPAQNFGILVVSTPQGIMTHYEAKEKGIGGKLLAYCY